jgi:hypothetical protein
LRRRAGDEDVVLDRDRYPIQRAEARAGGLTRGGSPGRGRSAVAIHVGECIQDRFQRIQPRKRLVEQLQRRDLSRIEQRRQRRGFQLPGQRSASQSVSTVRGANLYPTKQRSDEQIDATVALEMMAIGP